MTQASRPIRTLITLLVLVVFLAPLTLLVSVYGTRLGFMDIHTGYGTIGQQVVPVLSYIGLGAAVLACLLLIKDRGFWMLSLASLVVAGVMVGGVVSQSRQWSSAPRDVTTNVEDAPAFAGRLGQERRAVRPVEHQPAACDGLAAVDSQLAAESVAWAMDKAGITVMGTSPFRVDGWTEGAIYGVRHDVTVRIRPGRTDLRVSGRDGLAIGDQACTLAKKLRDAMEEARNA